MAQPPDLPDVPEALAVPKRRWGFQWVWLLPIVAALIGGWLAVRAIVAQGPNVTIRFKTAEGIEANKTRVKYKDVDIGVVKSISLADDRAGIIVKASLSRAAQDLLVDLAVHFVKARGNSSKKVFKVKRVLLPPRGAIELRAGVSLKVHTTRKPQPGKHAVDVLVNGTAFSVGSFDVTAGRKAAR